jgi:hypothetical protein
VEAAAIGGLQCRTMRNPETWKTLLIYIKGGWNSVGPLVGVLVGAWLARSWDKRKWIDDNRKEECRELLTAIIDAASVMIRHATARGVSQNQVDEGYVTALKTFENRIFIATDVENQGLVNMWADAVSRFSSRGSVEEFDFVLDIIKKKIIAMAIKA